MSKLAYLVLSLVFISCTYTHSSKQEPKYTIREFSESNDVFDIKTTYPQFNNLFIDSLVNTVFKNSMAEFMAAIADPLPSENWKYEQKIGFKYSYNDVGIASILIWDYQFTGGAHGNTILHTLVISPDEKQQYKLSDFFKGSAINELRPLVRQKLRNMVSSEEYINEGTETLANFSKFTLSNDSLYIYFSPYQVSCYADGTPIVACAITEFSNFVWPNK